MTRRLNWGGWCRTGSIVLMTSIMLLLLATATATPQLSEGRPIRCTVTVSTATTLTAVGGQCAAPPGDQAIHITDILASASAAAGTAADAQLTLKYGTGGTCGTGTTVIWQLIHPLNTVTAAAFVTPIVIPRGNELCWINSTAATKTWLILGFIR